MKNNSFMSQGCTFSVVFQGMREKKAVKTWSKIRNSNQTLTGTIWKTDNSQNSAAFPQKRRSNWLNCAVPNYAEPLGENEAPVKKTLTFSVFLTPRRKCTHDFTVFAGTSSHDQNLLWVVTVLFNDFFFIMLCYSVWSLDTCAIYCSPPRLATKFNLKS